MMSLYLNKQAKVYWYLATRLCFKKKFFHIGKRTIIFQPMQFSGVETVSIGDHCVIAHYVWLMGKEGGEEPTLTIGDRVNIGHFAHIVARSDVTIEDNVLIADRVFISDTEHDYIRPDVPIQNGGLRHVGRVRIGNGSWVGENACIMGCSIGRNCVIGANSVVIHDIPDGCVAAGVPARIIKRYNVKEKIWEKVKDET